MVRLAASALTTHRLTSLKLMRPGFEPGLKPLN
jgi:hypothetical protein